MRRAIASLLFFLVASCGQSSHLIGEYLPISAADTPPSGLGSEQCVLATATESMRYFTCAHARTWDSAQATCASAQGELTRIDDPTLEAALAQTVTSEAWIGLEVQPGTRIFQWVDGTAPTYEAFGPTEPDNFGGTENCAALAASDDAGQPGWDDRDCVVDLPYICAVPP
jgi:hypothetical protein